MGTYVGRIKSAMLGRIISAHFFPDNLENEVFLTALIINDVNSSRKFRMLKNLLRLKYPRLRKEYSKVLKEVDAIMERRNDFAHAAFGPSDDYVAQKATDKVQLRVFRDGELKTVEIPVLTYNKWLEDASKTLISLKELEGKVRIEAIQNQ